MSSDHSPSAYDEKDQTSIEKTEKGPEAHDYVVHPNAKHLNLDATEGDGVQRRLKQRHVQMIAVSPRLAQIFLA